MDACMFALQSMFLGKHLYICISNDPSRMFFIYHSIYL